MSRPQALALTAATLLGTAVGCLYLWRTLRKPKLKRALTSQNGEVVNRQSSSPNGSEEACYQTSTDHLSNPSPLVHKILGAGAFVVESEVDWDQVWPLVRAELDHYPVIGIDCEWVSVKGKANPVSLLQIASYSGSCLLIRMPQMTRNSSLLPKTLLRVLGDDNILKVGVDAFEDGCRLLRDYCVTVKGCLDLRYLVTQQRKNNLAHSLSLKSLAQDIINFTLDKSLHLRCSNWEAPELTNEQVTYAAQDAQVSVALFFHLLGFSSTSHEDVVLSQSEPSWEQVLARCQGLKDIPFKNKMGGSSRREEGTGETNSQQRRRNKKLGPNQKLPWDTTTVDPRKTQRKPLGVGYSARKSPLYDNCFLHAPDGQPLCTCDRKKAQWKNIVPHEYRKHFPIQMKDHNSHDVLLLCTACHAASNCYDNILKQQLAKEFNAPVGSEESVRLLEDPVRRQVRSGARALLNAESLPKTRREELQDILKAFFNVEVLSEELLEEGAALETRIFNESHIPHGLKVTQSCAVGGLRALMSLEKRWRQHFLDYMQPQHLPPLWSVDHNHNKLLRKYGEDLKLELT
ncbi:exonuclease 3'-5' domain-containing protein 2 isoform X2 [Hemitrygon akajei]|uniref:exonuclease 3'-5' domain-containing protein 2 isoform X2 n=1 Tax=Hemitrygon akajei TaxID=2704970 RepID=UPI003BF9FFBD